MASRASSSAERAAVGVTDPASAAASQPAPSSTDRRAHRRTTLDVPVLVETDARSATARCIDLGPGGVRVLTDLALAAGDEVGVYLELPIGLAVETRAAVVRREGDVVALRFVDPPRDAVIAIRGFCRMSSTSTPRAIAG